MNIKNKIKKNGQKIYYASVYLGVDQLTGKKARTTVTATTKKDVRVKVRDVIVPRKQQKEKAGVKYLDNKVLKQFLDYLDTLDQSNYENLFDIVLYKTLLATGCRIGEALALEWSDIKLDNGIISIISINKTLNRYQEINSPKSSAGYRDIPIDNATLLMLKQYKNRQQVQSWQLGRTETVVFSVFTEKYLMLVI